MKKTVAFLLCFILAFSTLGFTYVSADEPAENIEITQDAAVKSEAFGYQDYLKEIENNADENGKAAFSVDALSYQQESSSKLTVSEDDMPCVGAAMLLLSEI